MLVNADRMSMSLRTTAPMSGRIDRPAASKVRSNLERGKVVENRSRSGIGREGEVMRIAGMLSRRVSAVRIDVVNLIGVCAGLYVSCTRGYAAKKTRGSVSATDTRTDRNDSVRKDCFLDDVRCAPEACW